MGSSWVSNRPNPVTTTSRMSALPSPSMSLRKRMSGALATQTPPDPTAIPDGMFKPSAKTVNLSALPSPSVSSRTLTRSRPGPAECPGVLQALGDPDPASLVEGHGDRIDNLGLAGDQLDRETGRHGHPGDRLGRRERRSRRPVLGVGDRLTLLGPGQRDDQERQGQCPGRRGPTDHHRSSRRGGGKPRSHSHRTRPNGRVFDLPGRKRKPPGGFPDRPDRDPGRAHTKQSQFAANLFWINCYGQSIRPEPGRMRDLGRGA